MASLKEDLANSSLAAAFWALDSSRSDYVYSFSRWVVIVAIRKRTASSSGEKRRTSSGSDVTSSSFFLSCGSWGFRWNLSVREDMIV
jgi:hypothetical protein